MVTDNAMNDSKRILAKKSLGDGGNFSSDRRIMFPMWCWLMEESLMDR
jgi:hypothetical protein